MATMNISLPDEMKAWVEEQVATGRYASASDVMRDALRREQDRNEARERIAAEIEKGYRSGPGEPFDREEFRAQMLARYGKTGLADVG